MLDKIVKETTEAVVAAIRGADDVISALRTAIKNQFVRILAIWVLQPLMKLQPSRQVPLKVLNKWVAQL
jgi:phosphate/sulfate permease